MITAQRYGAYDGSRKGAQEQEHEGEEEENGQRRRGSQHREVVILYISNEGGEVKYGPLRPACVVLLLRLTTGGWPSGRESRRTAMYGRDILFSQHTVVFLV